MPPWLNNIKTPRRVRKHTNYTVNTIEVEHQVILFVIYKIRDYTQGGVDVNTAYRKSLKFYYIKPLFKLTIIGCFRPPSFGNSLSLL